MVYKWKDGIRGVAGITPEVAGKCIEKIIEMKGNITPVALLEAARSEKHPLHNYFIWDDAIAAERYRQEQAGYIIRHIVIEPENITDSKIQVRAFVNVEEDKESHYTTIGNAMANPALREQVISKAYKELKSWENKYWDLKEFAEVFDAIKLLKVA